MDQFNQNLPESTGSLDYILQDLGATIATPQPTTQTTQPQQPTKISEEELAGLGARYATEQEAAEAQLTTGEKFIGGLEAVGRGFLTRPGLALIQKGLGVKPEESKLRETGLGGVATGLELFGLAGPALATLGAAGAARLGVGAAAKAIAPLTTLGEFTQAGLLTKAGQAAVKGLGVKGAIAAPAVAMGVENALFAVADETAKAIEGNPNNAQKALYNVALSGALGTVTGGAIGKVGDLWKTSVAPKYKGFFSDFTGRLKDHQKGNLPAAEAVATELQTVLNAAKEETSEIFGVTGLKRQELSQLLPDKPNETIVEASNKALNDINDYLKQTLSKPAQLRKEGAKIIDELGNQLAADLTDPNLTASEIFAKLDDFKKEIGPYGEWKKRGIMAEEVPAKKEINKLFGLIKENLENENVWGLAAKRQKEINKASSKFFQSLRPFKKLVMSEGPDGILYVDPAKLETLIKQSTKGTARGIDKQARLDYFLDVVDDLYNTIDDLDSRLGLGAVSERPSMTASRAVTEKLTPGMKAADLIYNQAINTAATGAGGYVGYKAGKMTGLPGGEWAGALFGSQALEPIIKKVLPVLIKPMSGTGATAQSVRAASQLINAVANGENLSKLAADSLFLKDKAMPFKQVAQSDLDKIDKKAREVQSDPQSLLELNDDLNQVLPNQGFALGNASMMALSYINSKRPAPKKNGLLDKEIPPSAQQMANFRRTLEIAENPLIVMKRIKDGTLRSSDVIDLKNMYPNLYDDMLEKMYESMVKHTTKGQRVPYKVQKYLSLYAGQPLEAGLTPQAIQAAQATYQQQPEPQAQQLPQMAKKSSRKSELPEQTRTDQQRRILKD